MQSKGEKEAGTIKYPGRVDIVHNEKVLETLPAVERVADKKTHKAALKNKPNTAVKLNYEGREGEQKSAEQSL
jgi:hypothetical protein